MKGDCEMTALQYPKIQSETSDEVWIQLLSTPRPQYNQRIHYELEYQ